MKLPLSARWFLWLSIAVTVFCIAQILGLICFEVLEVMRNEGSLKEELMEISMLLSVSGGVFILMLGGFWFISKRMMRPIQVIANAAHRISKGDLMERIEGEVSADEIGMLVATLNQAFDRYHEMVRRLERFAGNAAHQLRTPLASIQSLGEVCLQKERNPSEYRECIGDILDVTREFTEIVEKLLMMARMNPMQLRQLFRPVVVFDVLSLVLDVYEVVLEEKAIRLALRDVSPVTVNGDQALIHQAIGNAVDNAVRYTPAGGSIDVSLIEQGGGALLRICDTGPGIPESMRLGLRGDAGQAAWNGELPTGRMGLAIVAEIMRIHEGTMDLRAHEGGGTCVELFWPSTTGRQTGAGKIVNQSPRRSLFAQCRKNARTITPAPTRRIPVHSLTDGRSPRKRTANTPTSNTLNLSTVATFDASPIFRARK